MSDSVEYEMDRVDARVVMARLTPVQVRDALLQYVARAAHVPDHELALVHDGRSVVRLEAGGGRDVSSCSADVKVHVDLSGLPRAGLPALDRERLRVVLQAWSSEGSTTTLETLVDQVEACVR